MALREEPFRNPSLESIRGGAPPPAPPSPGKVLWPDVCAKLQGFTLGFSSLLIFGDLGNLERVKFAPQSSKHPLRDHSQLGLAAIGLEFQKR